MHASGAILESQVTMVFGKTFTDYQSNMLEKISVGTQRMTIPGRLPEGLMTAVPRIDRQLGRDLRSTSKLIAVIYLERARMPHSFNKDVQCAIHLDPSCDCPHCHLIRYCRCHIILYVESRANNPLFVADGTI